MERVRSTGSVHRSTADNRRRGRAPRVTHVDASRPPIQLESDPNYEQCLRDLINLSPAECTDILERMHLQSSSSLAQTMQNWMAMQLMRKRVRQDRGLHIFPRATPAVDNLQEDDIDKLTSVILNMYVDLRRPQDHSGVRPQTDGSGQASDRDFYLHLEPSPEATTLPQSDREAIDFWTGKFIEAVSPLVKQLAIAHVVGGSDTTAPDILEGLRQPQFNIRIDDVWTRYAVLEQLRKDLQVGGNPLQQDWQRQFSSFSAMAAFNGYDRPETPLVASLTAKLGPSVPLAGFLVACSGAWTDMRILTQWLDPQASENGSRFEWTSTLRLDEPVSELLKNGDFWSTGGADLRIEILNFLKLRRFFPKLANYTVDGKPWPESFGRQQMMLRTMIWRPYIDQVLGVLTKLGNSLLDAGSASETGGKIIIHTRKFFEVGRQRIGSVTLGLSGNVWAILEPHHVVSVADSDFSASGSAAGSTLGSVSSADEARQQKQKRRGQLSDIGLVAASTMCTLEDDYGFGLAKESKFDQQISSVYGALFRSGFPGPRHIVKLKVLRKDRGGGEDGDGRSTEATSAVFAPTIEGLRLARTCLGMGLRGVLFTHNGCRFKFDLATGMLEAEKGQTRLSVLRSPARMCFRRIHSSDSSFESGDQNLKPFLAFGTVLSDSGSRLRTSVKMRTGLDLHADEVGENSVLLWFALERLRKAPSSMSPDPYVEQHSRSTYDLVSERWVSILLRPVIYSALYGKAETVQKHWREFLGAKQGMEGDSLNFLVNFLWSPHDKHIAMMQARTIQSMFDIFNNGAVDAKDVFRPYYESLNVGSSNLHSSRSRLLELKSSFMLSLVWLQGADSLAPHQLSKLLLGTDGGLLKIIVEFSEVTARNVMLTESFKFVNMAPCCQASGLCSEFFSFQEKSSSFVTEAASLLSIPFLCREKMSDAKGCSSLWADMQSLAESALDNIQSRIRQVVQDLPTTFPETSEDVSLHQVSSPSPLSDESVWKKGRRAGEAHICVVHPEACVIASFLGRLREAVDITEKDAASADFYNEMDDLGTGRSKASMKQQQSPHIDGDQEMGAGLKQDTSGRPFLIIRNASILLKSEIDDLIDRLGLSWTLVFFVCERKLPFWQRSVHSENAEPKTSPAVGGHGPAAAVKASSGVTILRLDLVPRLMMFSRFEGPLEAGPNDPIYVAFHLVFGSHLVHSSLESLSQLWGLRHRADFAATVTSWDGKEQLQLSKQIPMSSDEASSISEGDMTGLSPGQTPGRKKGASDRQVVEMLNTILRSLWDQNGNGGHMRSPYLATLSDYATAIQLLLLAVHESWHDYQHREEDPPIVFVCVNVARLASSKAKDEEFPVSFDNFLLGCPFAEILPQPSRLALWMKIVLRVPDAELEDWYGWYGSVLSPLHSLSVIAACKPIMVGQPTKMSVAYECWSVGLRSASSMSSRSMESAILSLCCKNADLPWHLLTDSFRSFTFSFSFLLQILTIYPWRLKLLSHISPTALDRMLDAASRTQLLHFFELLHPFFSETASPFLDGLCRLSDTSTFLSTLIWHHWLSADDCSSSSDTTSPRGSFTVEHHMSRLVSAGIQLRLPPGADEHGIVRKLIAVDDPLSILLDQSDVRDWLLRASKDDVTAFLGGPSELRIGCSFLYFILHPSVASYGQHNQPGRRPSLLEFPVVAHLIQWSQDSTAQEVGRSESVWENVRFCLSAKAVSYLCFIRPVSGRMDEVAGIAAMVDSGDGSVADAGFGVWEEVFAEIRSNEVESQFRHALKSLFQLLRARNMLHGIQKHLGSQMQEQKPGPLLSILQSLFLSDARGLVPEQLAVSLRSLQAAIQMHSENQKFVLPVGVPEVDDVIARALEDPHCWCSTEATLNLLECVRMLLPSWPYTQGARASAADAAGAAALLEFLQREPRRFQQTRLLQFMLWFICPNIPLQGLPADEGFDKVMNGILPFCFEDVRLVVSGLAAGGSVSVPTVILWMFCPECCSLADSDHFYTKFPRVGNFRHAKKLLPRAQTLLVAQDPTKNGTTTGRPLTTVAAIRVFGDFCSCSASSSSVMLHTCFSRSRVFGMLETAKESLTAEGQACLEDKLDALRPTADMLASGSSAFTLLEVVVSSGLSSSSLLSNLRTLCLVHSEKFIVSLVDAENRKSKRQKDTEDSIRALRNILLQWFLCAGLTQEDLQTELMPVVYHIVVSTWEQERLHSYDAGFGKDRSVCRYPVPALVDGYFVTSASHLSIFGSESEEQALTKDLFLSLLYPPSPESSGELQITKQDTQERIMDEAANVLGQYIGIEVNDGKEDFVRAEARIRLICQTLVRAYHDGREKCKKFLAALSQSVSFLDTTVQVAFFFFVVRHLGFIDSFADGPQSGLLTALLDQVAKKHMKIHPGMARELLFFAQQGFLRITHPKSKNLVSSDGDCNEYFCTKEEAEAFDQKVAGRYQDLDFSLSLAAPDQTNRPAKTSHRAAASADHRRPAATAAAAQERHADAHALGDSGSGCGHGVLVQRVFRESGQGSSASSLPSTSSTSIDESRPAAADSSSATLPSQVDSSTFATQGQPSSSVQFRSGSSGVVVRLHALLSLRRLDIGGDIDAADEHPADGRAWGIFVRAGSGGFLVMRTSRGIPLDGWSLCEFVESENIASFTECESLLYSFPSHTNAWRAISEALPSNSVVLGDGFALQKDGSQFRILLSWTPLDFIRSERSFCFADLLILNEIVPLGMSPDIVEFLRMLLAVLLEQHHPHRSQRKQVAADEQEEEKGEEGEDDDEDDDDDEGEVKVEEETRTEDADEFLRRSMVRYSKYFAWYVAETHRHSDIVDFFGNFIHDFKWSGGINVDKMFQDRLSSLSGPAFVHVRARFKRCLASVLRAPDLLHKLLHNKELEQLEVHPLRFLFPATVAPPQQQSTPPGGIKQLYPGVSHSAKDNFHHVVLSVSSIAPDLTVPFLIVFAKREFSAILFPGVGDGLYDWLAQVFLAPLPAGVRKACINAAVAEVQEAVVERNWGNPEKRKQILQSMVVRTPDFWRIPLYEQIVVHCLFKRWALQPRMHAHGRDSNCVMPVRLPAAVEGLLGRKDLFGVSICSRGVLFDLQIRYEELRRHVAIVDARTLSARGIRDVDQVYGEIIRLFLRGSTILVYVRGLCTIEDRLLKWLAEYTKRYSWRYVFLEEVDTTYNFSENRDRCSMRTWIRPSLDEVRAGAVASAMMVLPISFRNGGKGNTVLNEKTSSELRNMASDMSPISEARCDWEHLIYFWLLGGQYRISGCPEASEVLENIEEPSWWGSVDHLDEGKTSEPGQNELDSMPRNVAGSQVLLLFSPPGAGKTHLVKQLLGKIFERRGIQDRFIDCSSDMLLEQSLAAFLENEAGASSASGRSVLLLADEYHMLDEDQKWELWNFLAKHRENPRFRAILIGNRKEKIDDDLSAWFSSSSSTSPSSSSKAVVLMCRLALPKLQKARAADLGPNLDRFGCFFSAARTMFSDEVLTFRSVEEATAALCSKTAETGLGMLLLSKMPWVREFFCDEFSRQVLKIHRELETLSGRPLVELKQFFSRSESEPVRLLAKVSAMHWGLKKSHRGPSCEEAKSTEASSLLEEHGDAVPQSFPEFFQRLPDSVDYHPLIRLACWVTFLYTSLGVTPVPDLNCLQRLIIMDQTPFPLIIGRSYADASLDGCHAFCQSGDFSNLEWIRRSLQQKRAIHWKTVQSHWQEFFINDVSAFQKLLVECPDKAACLKAVSPQNICCILSESSSLTVALAALVMEHLKPAFVLQMQCKDFVEKFDSDSEIRCVLEDGCNPYFHSLWFWVRHALVDGSRSIRDLREIELEVPMSLPVRCVLLVWVGRHHSTGQQSDAPKRAEMVLDLLLRDTFKDLWAAMFKADASCVGGIALFQRMCVFWFHNSFPSRAPCPCTGSEFHPLMFHVLASCQRVPHFLWPPLLQVLCKLHAGQCTDLVDWQMACKYFDQLNPFSGPLGDGGTMVAFGYVRGVWESALRSSGTLALPFQKFLLLQIPSGTEFQGWQGKISVPVLERLFLPSLHQVPQEQDILPLMAAEQNEFRKSLVEFYNKIRRTEHLSVSSDAVRGKMRLEKLKQRMKFLSEICEIHDSLLLEFYNPHVGKKGMQEHRKHSEEVDEFKNPTASDFDLGRTGAFSGFQILIGQFFRHSEPKMDDRKAWLEGWPVLYTPELDDETLHENLVSATGLTEKDLSIQICNKEEEFSSLLNDPSRNFQLAWIISGTKETWMDGRYLKNELGFQNSAKGFLVAVHDFHHRGGGLMVFGENDPFHFHANIVLCALFNQTNLTIGGNVPASNIVCNSENPEDRNHANNMKISSGKFVDENSLVVTGIVNLYEGITICEPTSRAAFEAKGFKVVVQGGYPDGTARHVPITMTWEPPAHTRTQQDPSTRGRIVVDSGFTKLWKEWKVAGTARYVNNCCVWLLSIDLRLKMLTGDLQWKQDQPRTAEQERRIFAYLKSLRPQSTVQFSSAVADRLLQTESNNSLRDMDVVLLLDISSSMATEVHNLRIFSKDIVARFLPDRAGPSRHRVGIVLFSCDAWELVPLTNDSATLKERIDRIESKGTTNYSSGLRTVEATLRKAGHPSRDRASIVMFQTDGAPSDEKSSYMSAATVLIRELKATVYGIGVFGNEDKPMEALQSVVWPRGLDDSKRSQVINERCVRFTDYTALVEQVGSIVSRVTQRAT